MASHEGAAIVCRLPVKLVLRVLPALLCLVLVLGLAGCGGGGPPPAAVTGPLPAKGDLLFVLRGPTTVGDGGRVRVKVATVEWFTDRPQRRAGIAQAHQLVDRWRSYRFDKSPPNAAVTGRGVDAVLELREPTKVPNGISFNSRPIRGELPPGPKGRITLFVDGAAVNDQITD